MFARYTPTSEREREMNMFTNCHLDCWGKWQQDDSFAGSHLFVDLTSSHSTTDRPEEAMSVTNARILGRSAKVATEITMKWDGCWRRQGRGRWTLHLLVFRFLRLTMICRNEFQSICTASVARKEDYYIRRMTFSAIRVASRCARPADNGSSKQEIKWSTFSIIFVFC